MATGVFLFIASVSALLVVNIGFHNQYETFFHTHLTLIQFGQFELNHSLRHWINDGLMVLFFFVAGLEIKRELVLGDLARPKAAALPIFSAVGGMLIPALIYLLFNPDLPARSGWGIPMATDIAFSLGVLSLIKKNVPLFLKIFLLTLAIVDDLGAIIVIALFYTQELYIQWLSWGLMLLLALYLVNKLGLYHWSMLVVMGLGVWVCFLNSGVHPTIAGVLLGFVTPLRHPLKRYILADRYIHKLHPVVNFIILPLFAFANSGILISGGVPVFDPVTLGIIFGLVVGKPLGVFGFAFLSLKLKLTSLPSNVHWRHILGVGFLTGIGFTVSLFIANLSFTTIEVTAVAKVGVLIGSVISTMLGLFFLRSRPWFFRDFKPNSL